MRRRLSTLVTLLFLGAISGAQPDRSAGRDAEERPASSRAAAFSTSYRGEIQDLKRDVEARRADVAPSGMQRLEGIRQRADELDEDASRLGPLDRGGLRRAQRGLRRELQRLRRELDRTPRAQ